MSTGGAKFAGLMLARKVGNELISTTHKARRLTTEQLVFGNASRRGVFNKVFEKAQEQLQHVFGMEMTELPAKEKVTIAQKRGVSSFVTRFYSCGFLKLTTLSLSGPKILCIVFH